MPGEAIGSPLTEQAGSPLSVVMATLNGGAYVREQLDSLAAQTVLPLELLVGDDGSADATPEIVAAFARTAPFPVILTRNEKRLGYSDNFLALCAGARGRLIAFCDQDDVWDARKLERVIPWFGDPGVALVLHRTAVVGPDLRPLGWHWPPIRRTVVRRARRVDPWFPAYGMTMVFRKSLLDIGRDRARPPSRNLMGGPIAHDEWVYALSGSLGRTVFLAEDLALYRQHGSALVSTLGRGVRGNFDRSLRFGAADYRRRATLFRAHEEFWSAIAAEPATAADVRDASGRAASWYARLARGQEARVVVRDTAIRRHHRALRLLRLVIAGGYRPRTMAGLGVYAFVGDLLGLVARGPGRSESASDREIAARVAAKTAAGWTPEEIAAALTQEGVVPLHGSRWSADMIPDLLYLAQPDARPSAASAHPAVQGPLDPCE